MNSELLISLLTAAFLLVLVGVIVWAVRRFRESRAGYAKVTDFSGAEIVGTMTIPDSSAAWTNWASRTPTLPSDSRE
jgi:cbb3-type cytochrome oxidase subunit 3